MLITQKGSSQDTEYTQRSGRENVHQAQACMMMRRKIQEGEACAACGAILKHRQNCLQRTKCDVKVCNAACSTEHIAQWTLRQVCAAAVAVAQHTRRRCRPWRRRTIDEMASTVASREKGR